MTRLPGAPARRGGRAWEEGETTAELTPMQVAAIADDPLYRIEAQADAPPPAAAAPANPDTSPAGDPAAPTTPPAGAPAGGRPRRRKGAA